MAVFNPMSLGKCYAHFRIYGKNIGDFHLKYLIKCGCAQTKFRLHWTNVIKGKG